MYISEIIYKGWAEMKKDFWNFAAVIFLYISIIVGLTFLLKSLKLGQMLSQIIIIIVEIWLIIGITIISLKKAKAKDFNISDLFSGSSFLASSMGANVLYFLMIIAGLILLIFPAVIWGIKYSFYQYLIIDKKMNAIDSLKASAKMTAGIKWDLLGVYFVFELILIIGLLACFIGLFWTVPVILIANALLYYKVVTRLKSAKKS